MGDSSDRDTATELGGDFMRPAMVTSGAADTAVVAREAATAAAATAVLSAATAMLSAATADCGVGGVGEGAAGGEGWDDVDVGSASIGSAGSATPPPVLTWIPPPFSCSSSFLLRSLHGMPRRQQAARVRAAGQGCRVGVWGFGQRVRVRAAEWSCRVGVGVSAKKQGSGLQGGAAGRGFGVAQ